MTCRLHYEVRKMSEINKTFADIYCVDRPCQLCEGTEKVTIFCGGPVAFLCESCYNILQKYWKLKEEYETFHKRRRVEVNSQIFFRVTFDNDPVQYIWG